jgi:hypothetical protein
VNAIEITELLTAIELAWPRNWPDGWERVWVPHVEDLPGPAAMAALSRMVRTHRHPPSVAELREAVARELDLLPPADGAARGYGYANDVVNAEYSHNEIPEPPSGVIGEAVRAFGGADAVRDNQAAWNRFWAMYAATHIETVLASKMTLSIEA